MDSVCTNSRKTCCLGVNPFRGVSAITASHISEDLTGLGVQSRKEPDTDKSPVSLINEDLRLLSKPGDGWCARDVSVSWSLFRFRLLALPGVAWWESLRLGDSK